MALPRIAPVTKPTVPAFRTSQVVAPPTQAFDPNSYAPHAVNSKTPQTQMAPAQIPSSSVGLSAPLPSRFTPLPTPGALRPVRRLYSPDKGYQQQYSNGQGFLPRWTIKPDEMGKAPNIRPEVTGPIKPTRAPIAERRADAARNQRILNIGAGTAAGGIAAGAVGVDTANDGAAAEIAQGEKGVANWRSRLDLARNRSGIPPAIARPTPTTVAANKAPAPWAAKPQDWARPQPQSFNPVM